MLKKRSKTFGKCGNAKKGAVEIPGIRQNSKIIETVETIWGKIRIEVLRI